MTTTVMLNREHDYYDFIDLARAFGIIAVVAIHSMALYQSKAGSDSAAFSALGLFARYAVPLFIVISGFLHKKNVVVPGNTAAWRNVVRNRASRLLVPYLFFSVLYIFIRVLIEQDALFSGFIEKKYGDIAIIARAVFLVENHPAGHLYFLPLLFFTMMLFTCLEHFIESVAKLLLTACVVSLCSYIFWGDIYSSVNPLKGLAFFAFGYYLRHSLYGQSREMRPESWRLAIISSAIFLLLMLAHQAHVVQIYQSKVFLFIHHLSGAVCIFLGASFIAESGMKQTMLYRALSGIGKCAFQIYLLHDPYILTVCFLLLYRYGLTDPFANQTAVLLAGVLIPIGISRLIAGMMPRMSKHILLRQGSA